MSLFFLNSISPSYVFISLVIISQGAFLLFPTDMLKADNSNLREKDYYKPKFQVPVHH